MSFGYFVNYVLGASLSYHFDPWLPPLDVYAMQVDAPFYFSFVLPYMLILVAFEKQTSALVDQANVQSRQLNAQTKTHPWLFWRALLITLDFLLPVSHVFGGYSIHACQKGQSPILLRHLVLPVFLARSTLTTGMFYDLILLGVFLMGK